MIHGQHNPTALRYSNHADTGDGNDGDYALVRKAVEFLTLNWQFQPSLAELSEHLSLGETQTQKLFTRWAGISPKEFSQAVTLDHAKRLLRDEGLPLLDASMELGYSSPSRLHDLFVTHESVSPGIWKEKGKGLAIDYGFHMCPFGQALVMTTTVNGEVSLVGLAFCDSGEEQLALEDMMGRWPNAKFTSSPEVTSEMAIRVFSTEDWKEDRPLKVTLIGTDFQIRVWETLLSIPFGKARTYSDIANEIGNAKAVRAVGAAVGRNPISFVVPCHRALGKSGSLTGYHWGLTRKRAMLGWEAGLVA